MIIATREDISEEEENDKDETGDGDGDDNSDEEEEEVVPALRLAHRKAVRSSLIAWLR